jgi:hypothetical protein
MWNVAQSAVVRRSLAGAVSLKRPRARVFAPRPLKPAKESNCEEGHQNANRFHFRCQHERSRVFQVPAEVKKQVLLCPVCGKSGPIGRFSIDLRGNPAQERMEYQPKIALCYNRDGDGRWIWTHHEVPLHVLIALRQQMAEALVRLDESIAEASGE